MDNRELILARLFVLLGTVEGVANVFRNKININETQKPAIILLDKDEEPFADKRDSNRPTNRPSLMVCAPELWVVLQGSADEVGTQLNLFRQRIIDKVMQDAALINLTLNQRSVFYDGCFTGFATGRNMEGQMMIQFSFRYLMRPDQVNSET